MNLEIQIHPSVEVNMNSNFRIHLSTDVEMKLKLQVHMSVGVTVDLQVLGTLLIGIGATIVKSLPSFGVLCYVVCWSPASLPPTE